MGQHDAPFREVEGIREGPRRTAALALLAEAGDDALLREYIVETHAQMAEHDAQAAAIRAQLGAEYPAPDRRPYRPVVLAPRTAPGVTISALKVVRRNLHVTPTDRRPTPHPWRVTHYDPHHGACGHIEYASLDAVADDLVDFTDGTQAPDLLRT